MPESAYVHQAIATQKQYDQAVKYDQDVKTAQYIYDRIVEQHKQILESTRSNLGI